MKICFYYKPTQAIWGGANSFVANLEQIFRQWGVEVTHDVNGAYDILFLNSAYKAPGRMFTEKEIREIRKTGYSSFWQRLLNQGRARTAKIIYRLDGLRKIYAGIESPMDTIQIQCSTLADHIIFQSAFAREVFAKEGYKGSDFDIVYNGVDQNIFNLRNRKPWKGDLPLRIVAASWSANPAKGHAMIADFSECADTLVTFIGNWPKGMPSKKVVIKGPVDQKELAEEFQGAHIFLFPALNEACSNVLIEALSSGLPVLYTDSGSNKEIAGAYGLKIDQQNPAKSLDSIQSDYSTFFNTIVRNHRKFSIESAAERYLNICKKLAP